MELNKRRIFTFRLLFNIVSKILLCLTIQMLKMSKRDHFTNNLTLWKDIILVGNFFDELFYNYYTSVQEVVNIYTLR